MGFACASLPFHPGSKGPESPFRPEIIRIQEGVRKGEVETVEAERPAPTILRTCDGRQRRDGGSMHDGAGSRAGREPVDRSHDLLQDEVSSWDVAVRRSRPPCFPTRWNDDVRRAIRPRAILCLVHAFRPSIAKSAIPRFVFRRNVDSHDPNVTKTTTACPSGGRLAGKGAVEGPTHGNTNQEDVRRWRRTPGDAHAPARA